MRRFKPKRAIRRRRGIRKGGFRTRGAKGLQASYHAPKHFTEVIKLTDIVSPATGGGPAGYNFSVTGNAIQNLRAALSDVFRQFTITGLKLMYLPAYNTYPLVAGTAIIPKIYFAQDKNDNTTPSQVTDMLQMDNLKIFDSSKRWTHYISYPRPYLESLNPATADHTPVQLAARGIQWLETDPLPPGGNTQSGLMCEWLNSIALIDANNSANAVTTGTVWARVYYACKEQK